DSLGGSAVVTVNASGIRLDGVVVDGDNTNLTSSVTLNGTNPDADSGVFASGSNGTLQNTVFRNFGGSGILACEDLVNCASATAGGDNVIRQNRFTNITNPSTWGIGVYAGDDFYAQINDNLFDQVRVGIQFAENDHLADTGAQPPQVQGNEIHATRIGLFFNLFYQSATTWSVTNNHIFASANAGQTGQWRGIQVESMQSAQPAVISGNVIDGSALLGQRSTVGYVLNNWTSSQSATTAIDGGSVSNADVGVLATDATNYTGPVNGALIQNIAFDNIALGAIYVEDTNEQSGSAAVTIGSGNTYSSVAHQLVLAGAAPGVSFSGGSVNDVLVRAAGAYFYGIPNANLCNPAACTTANALINTGIADVAASGTVYVEAGTFAQNVVVNKSVTLDGPFHGVAGFDGSRDGTGEAIISPASGSALTLAANAAQVDGFTLSIASGLAVVPGGASRDNLQFVNNRVVDITNGVGIRFEPGEGTPATGFTISGNLFADIGGSGTNGSAIELYKGTRNATVSNNHFDSVQQIALQANGGSGTVQGLTVTGNVVRDPDNVNPSDAFVLTKVTNAVVQGNDLQEITTGLFVSDDETSLRFVCNTVVATRGVSTGDFFGGVLNSGLAVFDNAISANPDISNSMAQTLTIGSNWYGGGNATVTGSNVQVADALPANPIGDPNCGDNTPTQIVVVSGSNQFAVITNSFAGALVGRLEDVLGGAVPGEPMVFTPPGSGASANLATPSGVSDYNGVFSTTAIANSVAGPYSVMLTDANFGSIAPAGFMLTNEAAQATITLNSADLSATYDGNPHAVGATTSPSGLSYSVTYNGSATVPTNAGSYYVVATIVDPSYAGSTSGTLVIAKAPATVTLSNLSQTYDGNPKPVTVTTSPLGLSTTVTYNGSGTPPSAVGSYSVVATVTDPNYTGSASATLTINAAAAPDIKVSISSDRSYVQYGKLLTYTILVQNVGNADAASVVTDAALPATLVNGNWTCVGSVGSTCGAASGSGDLHDTAVVLQSGVLVYTLTATVNDDPSLTTDQIAITATATVNGAPADSNLANNTATANTQIVIFRDGFETGGDGAQESSAEHILMSSMNAESTLSLDSAQAPQTQNLPQIWLRGVDASGRNVFRIDSLRIGSLQLMRLAVSDANGNLVPGAWLQAQPFAFAFGFAGSSGKYQAMLATGKVTLQLAMPAWAVLPVQVYTTH
ncbi:MAG: MBG domain-containing protein, partial [Rudaea sp.]